MGFFNRKVTLNSGGVLGGVSGPRRAPASAPGSIPIAAMSNVPLAPRGPALGFFVPPRYTNKAGPGNVAPHIDPPLAAMYGRLKEGVHF